MYVSDVRILSHTATPARPHFAWEKGLIDHRRCDMELAHYGSAKS